MFLGRIGIDLIGKYIPSSIVTGYPTSIFSLGPFQRQNMAVYKYNVTVTDYFLCGQKQLL